MNSLDLPFCAIPQELPANATEEQVLQHLGNLRTYRLCQIQSAQKHMEYLATELAKDSVTAGMLTRNAVRQFKDIEMAFLGDVRSRISKIVNKDHG